MLTNCRTISPVPTILTIVWREESLFYLSVWCSKCFLYMDWQLFPQIWNIFCLVSLKTLSMSLYMSFFSFFYAYNPINLSFSSIICILEFPLEPAYLFTFVLVGLLHFFHLVSCLGAQIFCPPPFIFADNFHRVYLIYYVFYFQISNQFFLSISVYGEFLSYHPLSFIFHLAVCL